MKKILAVAGMMLATNGFAGQLIDYAQVKSAVLNGESIRIATDFSKCLGKDNKSPKYSLGVFSPESIYVYADGTIKTSLKNFTLNDRNVPGKPVYQYVVYTINPDNTVRVSMYVMDAANYSMISTNEGNMCDLADGAKVYTR